MIQKSLECAGSQLHNGASPDLYICGSQDRSVISSTQFDASTSTKYDPYS